MIEPGRHTLPDGRTTEVAEIEGGGLRARIATLGAALLSLEVPGADGVADVALGHSRLADYVDDPAYLGVAIGRVAGRIGGAAVEVDGTRHRLDANEPPNTLHSGPSGLHSHVWRIAQSAPSRVILTTTSADGEGGFPGTLQVDLGFTLADGVLALDWTATTDRPTPVSLTHHDYVHLDGHAAGSVRGLTGQSDADRVVVLGPDLVPTGETVPVDGTPFDLRTPVPLATVLDAADPHVVSAGGLDHDLLVPPHGGRLSPLRRVATIRAQTRVLEVWTTEPGLHLYAGGALDVATGKDGAHYGTFCGLALETQPPADAMAHPGFPDTVLRPGETFRSRTEYRFAPA